MRTSLSIDLLISQCFLSLMDRIVPLGGFVRGNGMTDLPLFQGSLLSPCWLIPNLLLRVVVASLEARRCQGSMFQLPTLSTPLDRIEDVLLRNLSVARSALEISNTEVWHLQLRLAALSNLGASSLS